MQKNGAEKMGVDMISYITESAEVAASAIVSGNPMMAAEWEDMRQILIIHAWKKIGGGHYKPDKGAMKTFITAIIRNKAKSILRQARKNGMGYMLREEIDGGKPYCDVDEPDDLFLLESQAAKLLSEGMKKNQVAKKIGVSPWILRKRIVPKIRSIIKKHGIGAIL